MKLSSLTRHVQDHDRWLWAGARPAGTRGRRRAAGRAHAPDLPRPRARPARHAARGPRPASSDSADGTLLHAEVFGPEDGADRRARARLDRSAPVLDLRDQGAVRARHSASSPTTSAATARASRRPAATTRSTRFGEDLEAVLTRLRPRGQRAVVAGHSLGAMSIVAWAADHDVEPARRRGGAAEHGRRRT